MVLGGETEVESGKHPALKKWSYEFRETKAATVHRSEYQRGEGYMERQTWGSSEGPPQYSVEY